MVLPSSLDSEAPQDQLCGQWCGRKNGYWSDTALLGITEQQKLFIIFPSKAGPKVYLQYLINLGGFGRALITHCEGSWCSVAQSWLTLCDPVDCNPPGSSVHGIFKARILEWVAISFSRGSSWPRDHNKVSCITGPYHQSHQESLKTMSDSIF